MPEPLKNLYNDALIQSLCDAIEEAHQAFDSISFKHAVFCENWKNMELKDRMYHIADCLQQSLPAPYADALNILKTVSPQFNGFEYMFFPAFTECYGIDHYDISVDAMAHFTTNASSEFAVRPFIKRYPERMISQLKVWALSDNHHIRRLASEGCRPRLPWAMALPSFKQNPEPILPILECLKNDDSDYVRRSVANNLNDIAKDHPETVVRIVKEWSGQSSQCDRLLRHASRTLLKKAHPEIMAHYGFNAPTDISVHSLAHPKDVQLGDRLLFSFELKSAANQLGKLRIEYGMDFMKANGRQARKIFKISEADYTIASKAINSSHSFKEISTRRHYPGKHGLAIIVNGHELAYSSFELK